MAILNIQNLYVTDAGDIMHAGSFLHNLGRVSNMFCSILRTNSKINITCSRVT
jgi:hypothetical protein